jgi:hypothetical protein
MKRPKLISWIAFSIQFFLLVGCSLHTQARSDYREITGAFGFHFGEEIQSYEIKSEDEEVIVVEPIAVPQPNSLFERYALKLDRKSKGILEINGLNHSLYQKQCLAVKQDLISALRERYEFEKTESLEDLKPNPKMSLFYGESSNKSVVIVGCSMNVGFMYSNSDTLLMIRYLAPSAKNPMKLLSQ